MYEILTYLNDHKMLGMVVIATLAYLMTQFVTSNVRRLPFRRAEPRINRFLQNAPVLSNRRQGS